MASLRKNTAGQNYTFVLVNATTGAALTGATVTAKRTIDGGAQASATGTVTETAGGQYNFAPSQADTNGTNVSHLFTATNAIPVNFTFFTDNWDTTQPVITSGSGANQVAVDGSGNASANLVNIAGAAVSTTTAQLGVNTVKYNNQTAQTDANNFPKVDIEAINGSLYAATTLAENVENCLRGTCSGGTNTTAVVSSLSNPSSLTASGQLVGRVIFFDWDTSTAALQGQASNITASTTGATPTITFTALTGGTAPANGDTFSID